MQNNLSLLTVNWQINQNVFINAVVVEQIMRAELVKPNRFTRVSVASENAARPFVVPGAEFGIPNARIRRAVKIKFDSGS